MWQRISAPFRGFSGFITRRPTVSFFVLILVLFGIIVLGTKLRAPEELGVAKTPEPKRSEIFIVGSDIARLTVPAEVRKESVTEIVALTPGIITSLTATVGKAVRAGQVLATITNDYASGSLALQREIAATNDALTLATYPIEKRINELEKRKVKRDPLLSDLQEEIELKRLKIERKKISAERRTSKLRRELTDTNEAAFRPKTFVSGVVESVHVKRGEYVQTGDNLFTVRAGKDGGTTLEALVSQKTAVLFDASVPSLLKLSTGETVEILPTYFSLQETADGLYSIHYSLSTTLKNKVSDREFVSLALPLSPEDPERTLLPLDSVFQDTEGAWVITLENGVANSRPVTLGHIFGSFVEVTEGLPSGTHVILNRSVVAGDQVAVSE